jgi:hypothetical protein
MDQLTKTKFEDANALDKKVPQDLLMKYQNKWYILKAGLEWKANYLFGGGNYGVDLEILKQGRDGEPDYYLCKATFKTKDGVLFTNYGEASKANVSNPQMHKYMLHLALTRAECRVLRMATACGYTSVDEMDIGNGEKEIPVSPDDGKEPTAQQLAVLKGLKIETVPATQKEAKELIAAAVKGKNETA